MVGFHGTKTLSAVLRDGLRVPAYEGWGCRIGHVCIAETPEIAAAFALGPDAGVVTVRLDGLDLPEEGFHGGELRLHEDIHPDRLELFTEPVTDRVDDFGRLLRYVVRAHDGLNVNVQLVKLGAAAPYFYRGRRGRYAKMLERLARRARVRKLGLWRQCPHTPYAPTEGITTRR